MDDSLGSMDVDWTDLTCHVFASRIRESLRELPLDKWLERYEFIPESGYSVDSMSFINDHFFPKMAGRSFFLTDNGLMCLGSASAALDDLVCVPIGCRTPIILRKEEDGEYRYVGDAYVDEYMYGKAVRHLLEPRRGDRDGQPCLYRLH